MHTYYTLAPVLHIIFTVLSRAVYQEIISYILLTYLLLLT